MDRFQSESYSPVNVTRYFREHGELPIIEEGAVNICDNCRQSCQTLYPVFMSLTSNEVDFMACEICKEEAEVEAAKEAAPVRKPVRMQGELFQEVA